MVAHSCVVKGVVVEVVMAGLASVAGAWIARWDADMRCFTTVAASGSATSYITYAGENSMRRQFGVSNSG